MEQARISSSQGTQPAHAARGKPAALDAAGNEAAGAAGGFLALLAALGGEAPQEGQDGAVLLAPAEPELEGQAALLPGAAAQDTAALAAWQGLLAPAADGRPAVGAGPALPGDGLGASAIPGVLAGVDGVLQGLVAETAVLDTSVDTQGGPLPQGTVSGFGRAFSRMHSALAQRADSLETSTGGRAGIADTARHSLGQTHVATVAVAAQVAGERAMSGAVAERTAGGSIGPVGAELAAPPANGLLAAVASARGGESAGGGRPGEGPAGAWTDGAAAESPLEPGSADAATVFADPTQAGAEEQVADRVAYWIHQKTQNAELTLNRDGQPVEVSVSLSGNEAHVSFRSDQAQTRELLDQSMAQLRELLRSEGLVLSGMSVGTSAGNGAGPGNADSQRPRDGARQAQVASAVPAGSGSLLRGGASADRAVDIFV